MLFRGVILEGVACSGKTSALRALADNKGFQSLSLIVLTEHHTQRVLETRAELTAPDNVALLREHTDYLAGLHRRLTHAERWREEDLPNPRLRVVLERFHLTHVTSYAHLAWEDVEAFDQELASMNFTLVVLTTTASELQQRVASRGPEWAEFLAEPGQRDAVGRPHDFARQVEYFVRQQDEMLALAKRSRLPQVRIDSSALSSTEIAAAVLKLLI